MKNVACVGCMYHQIDKDFSNVSQGLILQHRCKRLQKVWKFGRFLSEAPETCPEREVVGKEA